MTARCPPVAGLTEASERPSVGLAATPPDPIVFRNSVPPQPRESSGRISPGRRSVVLILDGA